MGYVLGAMLVLFAIVAFRSLVIIHQSHAAVVEYLGKYSRTLQPGFTFVIPFLETIHKRFDTRETLHDFAPTAVITRDNASVRINAVTYYKVTDVKAAAYNVQNFEQAMEQLIITTMRNLIGEMELDELLNGRNAVNHRLQGVLDEATHEWGLKVSRVELKEVTPMGDVAEAMDKQMVAERTRRAQILEAEGTKSAAILQAEGAKMSAILRAEGDREVVMIRAQAEAEAMVITAKAQQEAIREVISAFGQNAEDKFLQLRYLDTLPKMADGRSSTIFMPTQLGPVAGLMAMAGEAFKATAGNTTVTQVPNPPAAARPAQPGSAAPNVRIS